MQSKNSSLIKALLAAIVLSGIGIGIYVSTTDGTLFHRIALLMGGNFLGGGYIQFLTYLAFFWCLFDVLGVKSFLTSEKQFVDKDDLLPDRRREQFKVLHPDEVNSIRMKAIQEASHGDSLYYDLVKKATTKFRTNRSISEMLDVISSQIRIYQTNAESQQSVIRYLAWAIPSIGFIGTVLGISQALGIADSGDTKLITTTLSVAFDTTLVSLILSIIIMWFIQNLQKQTDDYHSYLEEFVIDNLVNRIET